MSLVDQQCNELQSVHETDCPIGTLLLSHLVGCLIYKDEDICKLKLNFGGITYEKRIPLHEVTDTNIREQWTGLLQNAFVNHEIGRKSRSLKV